MAFGDSKKSTMFMAVSTVINIFLDLFLVVVVKWGVAGAAVATIFSQGIAGVLSAVYIFKKYKLLFPVNTDERKFHPYYMKTLLKCACQWDCSILLLQLAQLFCNFM